MDEEGGDDACWLDRVCDQCGALVERSDVEHRCRGLLAGDDLAGRSVSTTRIARHIRAPRAHVYRALINPAAVQQWMVPEQMTSVVHAFEAREGAHSGSR